jgi:imidazolonepropionase-like amidohydrolase
LQGPRIYFTGPVIDGPKPVWPDISAAISTEDQIPHFLGVLKLAGVDFVKAYTGLSDAMVRAVVDSAKRHSLRVIADVGPRNGSLETARTGIAAFAHAGRLPMTDDGVRYMAENGTMSTSTLAVYESFARRRFKDMSFLDQPLLKDVMPPSYREQLRAHGTKPMSAADSAWAQRLGGALGTAMANVKRMVDAGIVVAAGTDAPYPGDFYGEGLHRELELLVEAGLTPLQAISAATRDAARFIGPDADWGTLEPGKAADLLLVRGDPSVRIGDTRNVVTVIQGGRVVDRATLRYDPRTEPDFHPSPLRPH